MNKDMPKKRKLFIITLVTGRTFSIPAEVAYEIQDMLTTSKIVKEFKELDDTGEDEKRDTLYSYLYIKIIMIIIRRILCVSIKLNLFALSLAL